MPMGPQPADAALAAGQLPPCPLGGLGARPHQSFLPPSQLATDVWWSMTGKKYHITRWSIAPELTPGILRFTLKMVASVTAATTRPLQHLSEPPNPNR